MLSPVNEMQISLNRNFLVKDQKSALRKDFLKIRDEISSQNRELFNASICKSVMDMPAFKNAEVILSYSPFRNEADITAVNETALKMGKTLAFPRCIPGTSEMIFYTVKSLSELEKGSFSIYEPPVSCPVWTPSEKKALCIVPAVAYDKYGYRIGYGRGFYDRFLQKHSLTTLGVVYSPLLVKSLPKDSFDVSVDYVVTDKQVLTLLK
jgi:5-formyltetrahydrofolate cyclo-ligase